MRLTEARVRPLDDDEITPEQEEIVAPLRGGVAVPNPGPLLNIFRTMARAPKALKRFNLWGGYILSGNNAIAPRERELLILRTGWLCRSGYEWVQHKRIGLQCGLSDEEIERIKRGPDAPGWSAGDAALLRVADDLVRDFFVSDSTWAGLSDLSEKQRMDAVFTVGQYTQVSMFLNSFGVQLDPGQELDADFPEVTARVAGKTALVMGAGQTPGATIGNGRAIAVLLAREGARVLCADRELDRAEETAAAIRTAGGTAEAIACDVTNRAECDAAVAHWGAIDILVNNVGIGGNDGPAHKITEDAFDRIVSVNLKGVLNGIAAVIPGMRERRSGAIVSISSLAGIAGWQMVAYETSKAAVNRLTQSTALANGKYGIRVNAVAPGLMDTPMAIDGIARARGLDREVVRAERAQRVPLNAQMGDAWDTAYATLFLCSDEAKFVTGVILPVDGGMGARVG